MVSCKASIRVAGRAWGQAGEPRGAGTQPNQRQHHAERGDGGQ